MIGLENFIYLFIFIYFSRIALKINYVKMDNNYK